MNYFVDVLRMLREKHPDQIWSFLDHLPQFFALRIYIPSLLEQVAHGSAEYFVPGIEFFRLPVPLHGLIPVSFTENARRLTGPKTIEPATL